MQAKSLRTLLLGASAAFAVVAMAPSQAQAQFQVQANYNLDASAFGVGGGYNFNLGNLTSKNGITAVATFDYYFKHDFVTTWEVNANGKKDIPSVAGLYVGAGVGITHSSFSYDDAYCDIYASICDNSVGSSDFHLNVLTGYNFGSKGKGPFVEGGLGIGDGSSFRVGGGIRF